MKWGMSFTERMRFELASGMAAVNEAMRTADSAMESGMAALTGGMNFGF